MNSLPNTVAEIQASRPVACQGAADRRQAEGALRQHKAMLGVVARLARVGAWAVDVERDLVIWSDEVCAIHDDAILQTQDWPLRPVTASFGVASVLPHDDLDPAAFTSRADHALYMAKQLGRERVQCLQA
jgi:GGDEF domain-containing protein